MFGYFANEFLAILHTSLTKLIHRKDRESRMSLNNPCHQGMALPRVADGGDGMQIWRVSLNELDKQLRTTDKGWSSNFGVEGGAKTPLRKNQLIMKCYTGPRNWMDTLERPRQRKIIGNLEFIRFRKGTSGGLL